VARFRTEGLALTAGGVLFVAKALLDLGIGAPPANGTDLVAWQSTHKFLLAMVNEVSFIAIVLLVVGAVGLFASLDRPGRYLARWGCGLLSVNIPVMMVLIIIHGRLVYPVYSIKVQEPETLQLLVSLYYGGQHTVGLLLGVATILIALSMRATAYGNVLAWAGVLTGIIDVVGSYPWLRGVPMTIVCELVFAAWFIATGVKLTSTCTRRCIQGENPKPHARA
jgi:hypothetical protein